MRIYQVVMLCNMAPCALSSTLKSFRLNQVDPFRASQRSCRGDPSRRLSARTTDKAVHVIQNSEIAPAPIFAFVNFVSLPAL